MAAGRERSYLRVGDKRARLNRRLRVSGTAGGENEREKRRMQRVERRGKRHGGGPERTTSRKKEKEEERGATEGREGCA